MLLRNRQRARARFQASGAGGGGAAPINIVLPQITGVTETGSSVTLDVGVWAASPLVDHFDVSVEETDAGGTLIGTLLVRTTISGTSTGTIADPAVGNYLRLRVWAVTATAEETLATSALFGPFVAGVEFIGAFAFGLSAPVNAGYAWNYAITAANTITNNAYPVTNPAASPYPLGWSGTTNYNMSGSGKSDPRLASRVSFSTMTTPNCFFRIDVPGPGFYEIYMGFAATGGVACGVSVYQSSTTSLGTLLTGGTVTGTLTSTSVMGADGTVHTDEADWAAASIMGGNPMIVEVTGVNDRLHIIRSSGIATQLCCVAVFKQP